MEKGAPTKLFPELIMVPCQVGGSVLRHTHTPPLNNFLIIHSVIICVIIMIYNGDPVLAKMRMLFFALRLCHCVCSGLCFGFWVCKQKDGGRDIH